MNVDVHKITAEAVKLSFVRVLLTLIAVVPFVVVLLLRFLWLIPAFLIVSGKKGWETGDALVSQWQNGNRS